MGVHYRANRNPHELTLSPRILVVFFNAHIASIEVWTPTQLASISANTIKASHRYFLSVKDLNQSR